MGGAVTKLQQEKAALQQKGLLAELRVGELQATNDSLQQETAATLLELEEQKKGGGWG